MQRLVSFLEQMCSHIQGTNCYFTFQKMGMHVLASNSEVLGSNTIYTNMDLRNMTCPNMAFSQRDKQSDVHFVYIG